MIVDCSLLPLLSYFVLAESMYITCFTHAIVRLYIELANCVELVDKGLVETTLVDGGAGFPEGGCKQCTI